jgi:hypothetical protein
MFLAVSCMGQVSWGGSSQDASAAAAWGLVLLSRVKTESETDDSSDKPCPNTNKILCLSKIC